MRAIAALLRAGLLTAASYRMQFVFSLGSLVVTLVMLRYVANAVQPLMAATIAREGGEFFAFALVGMIVLTVIPTALQVLPTTLAAGIGTGTLETLMGTPTPLPALLAGMIGFDLLWAIVRGLLMGIAGVTMGVSVSLSGFVPGLAVLALILCAYLAIGAMAAALVVTFRTTGPLIPIVLTGSALLGGVYFPTHVIPSWIARVSTLVPLTYGLRALRMLWLDNAPWRAVAMDVLKLVSITAVLGVLGAGALSLALRHARLRGTLGQY